jgi:hypothetical protein
MWCFLLVMSRLDNVKQAQDEAGCLIEHCFALGGRDLSNPSGGADLAAGHRLKPLKTGWFPAVLRLASNKICHRRKHHINGSVT